MTLRAPLACVALAALSGAAGAHSFGERYDLPAPLAYFVAGGAAVVALSFVVAALIARSNASPAGGARLRAGLLLPSFGLVLRVLGLALFVAVLVAGFAGSRNPEANLAPTLVWIVWWVGLSLLTACCANVWPALDPWRTLFDIADALAQRIGRTRGLALDRSYPAALGVWPATVLLLAWSWFEVIYLKSSVPAQIAGVAAGWSVVTLAGMYLFGPATWQRHGDVFAVYFATLGRFAPLARDGADIVVRPWGRALTATGALPAGTAGFVLAMLSTVLFDGLLGGEPWGLLQRALAQGLGALADDNGYVVGTLGLAGSWLVLLAAFVAACALTRRLAGGGEATMMARRFALTLVPIAVAYLVAHNFANLLIQGQLIIRLASDPFGLKWDLFGTAGFEPDIGIVDARITWYVAITAIVVGHVISVWLAHRVALEEFASPRRAIVASIPLTVLMVVYTAISLSVMAEPLVEFRATEATVLPAAAR